MSPLPSTAELGVLVLSLVLAAFAGALATWALMGCAPTWSGPPAWVVAGSPLQWELDAQGVNVAEYSHPTRTIRLHRSALELDVPVRNFVAAHELCHALGETTELGADCCAMGELSRMRLLRAADVPRIALWLGGLPQGPEHPPGPVRAATAITCGVL